MTKIYFRLFIILCLLGAIYYVSNYKYKGVMRSFFIENAQLSFRATYSLTNQSGKVIATEFFEIQNGLHHDYFETKQFDEHNGKLSQAYRLVTDTTGVFIWSSYENFDMITRDSIAQKFALYSMFHEDRYMRSMPVTQYKEREKTDIELNGKHFLISTGLYSVYNVIPSHVRKEQQQFEMITLDTLTMTYNLTNVRSSFLTNDSSGTWTWNIFSTDSSDTLLSIMGTKSQLSFTKLIDYKNKITVTKLTGNSFKFKEVDTEAVKRGIR